MWCLLKWNKSYQDINIQVENMLLGQMMRSPQFAGTLPSTKAITTLQKSQKSWVHLPTKVKMDDGRSSKVSE